jgi:DNA modification methylase
MEIVNKKVEDLIPYINNSRTHNEEQIKQICASINEFGFTNPLLIDEKDNIIAGHGRLLASKKLNMEEVPCIVLKGLTEAQKKAYIIADNKLALNAGWDDELLKLELENLKELDFDISLTGFNIDELDDVLGEEKEVEEDDFDCTPPEEPKSKLGDIYQLGNHRLMCGDSTSIDDVEKLMNGVNADMIHTDPPYGINMSRSLVSGEDNSILNDNLNEDDLKQLIDSAISNCVMVSKPNIPLYCWIGFRNYSLAEDIIKKYFEINNCIVWIKPSIGLGGKGYRYQHELCIFSGNIENKSLSDVWEFKRDKSGLHPTMKPVELVANAIKNSSKKDDVILDVFGGSGSTLIACEQLNRKCYMMELDPKYVDVIIKRWETFTGQKAVKLN